MTNQNNQNNIKNKTINENIFAFIDCANLYLSLKSINWKINWKRFYVYLKFKYKVKEVYIFLGFVKENSLLYTELQKIGYVCIFKPTFENKDGKIKGNCDAELVLHTMIQKDNFTKSIIISGDGDFSCLIEYLLSINKINNLLVPNRKKYSGLLKNKKFKKITNYLNESIHKFAYKIEKAP